MRPKREKPRVFKDEQICRAAAETLALALATLDDEAWLDVELVSVAPAPNASRLAITLKLPDSADPTAFEAKLERVGGYLRAELAAALERRRVPLLSFRFIG